MLKMTHVIMTVLSLLFFIVAAVRLFFAWDSLPDDIGVHFNSDGNFDVFDKQHIFYPYIVTIAAIAVCETFELITRKLKKMGLAVNETGNNALRTATILILDLLMLLFSGFFSGIWVDCVLTQQPMNTFIGRCACYLLFACIIAFPVTFIVIRVKYPKNKKSETVDEAAEEADDKKNTSESDEQTKNETTDKITEASKKEDKAEKEDTENESAEKESATEAPEYSSKKKTKNKSKNKASKNKKDRK